MIGPDSSTRSPEGDPHDPTCSSAPIGAVDPRVERQDDDQGGSQRRRRRLPRPRRRRRTQRQDRRTRDDRCRPDSTRLGVEDAGRAYQWPRHAVVPRRSHRGRHRRRRGDRHRDRPQGEGSTRRVVHRHTAEPVGGQARAGERSHRTRSPDRGGPGARPRRGDRRLLRTPRGVDTRLRRPVRQSRDPHRPRRRGRSPTIPATCGTTPATG